MKDQLIGTVKEGEIHYDVGLMRRYLVRYEGKQVLVSLEKFQTGKSEAQRGYYFAFVRSAAEHFGWEHPELLHEFLKSECNKVEVPDLRTGEVKFIAGSTVPLKKMDFAAYVDRCIRLFAECDYIVPTPEEYFKAIGAK
jgi:hypothetical protein